MSAVVVVGGGLAGLTAALAGVEAGHEVTLLDDGYFTSSASAQAQGGFSAVTAAGLAAGDSVGSHVADTLEAGARHGDPAVAAAVCAAAEEHVGTLTRWGTVWDTDAEGAVSLTREAAHAASRNTAPSPRNASESMNPASTQCVGWNCTISTSARTAPARQAMAALSP